MEEKVIESNKIELRWSKNIIGDITEDFILRMTNSEFSLFLKCKFPSPQLREMANKFLLIGDEKRITLLDQLKLHRNRVNSNQ